jgi:glycine/D-amino acid oxidase-like deaminating enzyme
MQVNPLWPVDIRFPQLDRDLTVDVAVVGGGMAGISCAYQLDRAGYKVAVLERDEIGSGASGASSGVLYYGSGTNYVQAVELFGKETAAALWNETGKAIDEIAGLAETNSIECGVRRCGAIMAAKTDADLEDLKQEQKELATIDIASKLLSPDVLLSIYPLRRFLGGLTFDSVAQVHPARFASGLAKIHSLQIFENCESEWEESGEGVAVRTPKGRVTCSHLVVATNNQPCFDFENRFEIESSVILASQPTDRVHEAFPNEKILWSMEEKYDIVYPRGDRLILELYALGDENEKLAYYYPGIQFNVEQQWGDIWAKPADWKPIVGKVQRNVSVAIGMGDQGIIMSWVTGKNIQAVIEGKSNWFTDMASAKRFEQKEKLPAS